ncbi:MAG TPA: Calx-beta domain-containing protein [Pyrinomonadaceae bacterium]|nr:Calx-beta domain-containing protein [Pyrinomonadaceae bacterium]
MNYLKLNLISLGLLLLLGTASALGQNPQMVSVNAAGTGTGAGASINPVVTPNGRYVVFESLSGDLAPGDTNGKSDVFLRDLQTGTTALVSANSAGTASGNGDSNSAAVSADGRYVAFVSTATDLVAGVTDANLAKDVFIRDMWPGGTTRLVSMNVGGGKTGSKESTQPAISADGRVVAFLSEAINLVAVDGNGRRDVFVRDVQANVTSLVSVNSAGTAGGNGVSGPNYYDNSRPRLSADGNYVAFESLASNLAANDTNTAMDVFVRDLRANKTSLVSADMTGKAVGGFAPAINANGQFIAFLSRGTNLAPNDNNNLDSADVYVRDVAAGSTKLVSANNAGVGSSKGYFCFNPTISADGRYVAFASEMRDLTPTLSPDLTDNVYVRDLMLGKTTRASVGRDGAWPERDAGGAAISADGRAVAFVSSWDFAGNDTNRAEDVYVRDLRTLTTTLVSVSNQTWRAGALGTPYQPSISSDGRAVAFASKSGDLVANDNNNATDIFVTSLKPGSLQFAAAAYTVNENAGALTVAVKRIGATAGAVTVAYSTEDRTARAGTDYTATAGTLIFNQGEVSKTFTVPVKDNALDADNKTFLLRLDQPGGGGVLLAAQSLANVTIADNDPPPSLSVGNVTVTEGSYKAVTATFTIKLSAPSSKPVSVQYETEDGIGATFFDYTTTGPTYLNFLPGETTKTVSRLVHGDVLDEPAETFKLVLTSPTNATIAVGTATCTILDDDLPPRVVISDVAVTEPDAGTINACFTVKLSAPSGQTVTVKYATINRTAVAGTDYTAAALTTLTFLPGQTTKTVNIPVRGDTLKELNESFFVNLSGAVNATVADGQGLGTILNDD